MAWRGPRGPRDPLLIAAQHRANREHWKQLGLPCARCGRTIDYDGPYYQPGTRKLNLAAFVTGHKIDRAKAKALGWTAEQINALTNTQPECRGCSNKSGAKAGRKAQRAAQLTRAAIPEDARRW